MTKQKVIAVLGPTSSGKTSLSIRIAKKFNGEVISADSRQIYKGLNIGTGKVTYEEMEGVPHHLLDVASPNQKYSASDYVKDGTKAIHLILNNNKLPIIAGGTFFYVDALLGKATTAKVPPNEKLRAELEEKSNAKLFEILKSKDQKYAETIDKQNPRRLVRAIEIAESLGAVPNMKPESLYDALLLGISMSKEQLVENIHIRLKERLKQGMIEEVVGLIEEGFSREILSELGIEYKYISSYLAGEITIEHMKQEIETKSWQYAKRQLTWLKRDKEIQWVNLTEIEQINTIVENFLKK